MPVVASATLEVTPVLSGAQQSLTEQLTGAATPAGAAAGTSAGNAAAASMSESMGKVGGAMTKSLTAPILAVGAASVAAWKDVDAGLDIIIEKTGASGEHLDEMQGILNSIATTIPTDFETAGAAIGEVSTRFGIVGDDLETLSGQFVKFAALNNTDVTKSVDSVQKALSAFGLDADDASHMLDVLNAVGQQTGVSVETLTSGLIQNATAFQEMGLNADQAAAFMGQMEKSGANSETVMQGLRKALKNAAEDGTDMNTALADLQESILNGTDGMDGLTAAYDLFGKSGDQIYGAIQNGTLDFTNLAAAAVDAGDSVSATFEATLDPMDSFTTTMNEMKLAGMEIVEAAGPALSDVLSQIASGVSKAADAWNGLSPEMQDTIIKVAGIVAVAGPLLSIGGKILGGVSSLSGVLGGLSGSVSSVAGSAASAVAPVASAGASFGSMAGQALQLVALGAALWLTAEAFAILANTAIELTAAGWPAIAVMGGMVVAIGGLMAVAAALGPALTAGAVGIGVFGAAMVGIGAGIDLASQGIATILDAVERLTESISTNADGINSVVSNVGDTFGGVVTTISDGIATVIGAISGGISGVLDSVAGIFDSMGEAALNAGTGFEMLANAVINLVSNTGVVDLAVTLKAVSGGVKDINAAASGAGQATAQINTLSTGFKTLGTQTVEAAKQVKTFETSSKTSMNAVRAAFNVSSIAQSMRSAMNSAYSAASSGISSLRSLFANTRLSFYQHIAVPHFFMSGSFDAQTGNVPAISTTWYARAAELGARFTQPMIIGVGDAAQPEILIGEEKLKDLVGGKGITNTFYIYDAKDPEAVAQRVARELRMQARME